jgi:DNA invertase Pin-like site-specific DNA recombinase
MDETFRWAGEWPGYPTVHTLPGRDTRLQGRHRVSTTDQNPQLQLDALEEAWATRIFTDRGVSGATASRPHLDACLDHLREGDVLTVWKLDRPSRVARRLQLGQALARRQHCQRRVKSVQCSTDEN